MGLRRLSRTRDVTRTLAIRDYDEAIRLNPKECRRLQQPRAGLRDPAAVRSRHRRITTRRSGSIPTMACTSRIGAMPSGSPENTPKPSRTYRKALDPEGRRVDQEADRDGAQGARRDRLKAPARRIRSPDAGSAWSRCKALARINLPHRIKPILNPSAASFAPDRAAENLLMMERRAFIGMLGAAAVWPRSARAQPPAAPVIGFLGDASPEAMAPRVAAFRQGLDEIGYVEGRNLTIDWRSAERQPNRMRALAADLVGRRVAAIVTASDLATAAAETATSTIPIVFLSGSDPVRSGLAGRSERPSPNVTGLSWFGADLAPARLAHGAPVGSPSHRHRAADRIRISPIRRSWHRRKPPPSWPVSRSWCCMPATPARSRRLSPRWWRGAPAPWWWERALSSPPGASS